ncbi:hypothetical protein [Phenylobacterium montanum]|uniref:Uncharacterized protein n=1 Tax=Phenylobacterium montanum TaxID=2823693 RepID=A0A975FVN1_9CAUL|nr:hypothetical protein [Caulobacter sp. S6]QUD86155.1 hypothetical protein KCG34_13705 [Caulobacter sp. S6]
MDEEIQMLVVSQRAMPHLIALAEQEIARNRAIHEECGDDWPDDFDANDIHVFEIMLESLLAVQGRGEAIVDFTGKPGWFLLGALPDYVKRLGPSLTNEDFSSLEHVYVQGALPGARPFPTR